jgi:hypothetical protein
MSGPPPSTEEVPPAPAASVNLLPDVELLDSDELPAHRAVG